MANRGINKFIGIGVVGQDPDSRTLPNGNQVCTVSIATSESWKDKATGDKVEKTEWINLVFFNRLAEIVAQYVTKGSKIYVEGRLQTRNWEKDGVKHYSTEINCNELQMPGDNKPATEGQSQPATLAQVAQPRTETYDDFNNDIPF